MQLPGKRLILTGAASGIGRATLTALAAYPVEIIAVDIDPTALAAACQALTAQPAAITPYTCDLTQQTAIDGLFDFALAQWPGVDIFIANAGFAYYEQLNQPDWARLERIYQLNVLSPIYAAVKMRALNPDRPYRVVITASAMGLLGLPGYAVYGSTKAALHRFAEAYRYELADPATLSLVYPIGTRTAFFKAAAPDAAPVPWPNQTPEQVAAAIVRGLQQDRAAIYPSRLFRLFITLDRGLPFLRRIEQRLENRRFRQWLGHKQNRSTPQR